MNAIVINKDKIILELSQDELGVLCCALNEVCDGIEEWECSSSQALELGQQFLGKGYREVISGSGRYVSADGKRAFRMGVNDILGKHGGGPHVNLETLIPNTTKPGKMMVDRNIHIYLTD